MLHQSDRVGKLVAEFFAIAVNARSGRGNSGQQTNSGRIAQRRRAIGAGEGDALFCQSINVWRGCLWMAAKVTNPVTQIVDRNEEYVWPIIGKHWLAIKRKRDPP